MGTDSFLALACAGLIGILFGLVVCFAGYRLFLVLLPIWGFIFGLVFGAQTMQALLPANFPMFASVTSWVVGFIVGGVFAVLSYLFYMVAVAIIAGSLGYSIGAGLLLAIGMQMNFLVWLIGIVVAVVLVVVTFRFNLAKWVIIIATGVAGAELIIGSIILMFYPHADILANPVKAVLNASPLTAILGIVVAVLGILAQVRQSRNFKLAEYDRWSEPA
jgi:hypothetical protein